ncbi:HTH DNA binding domain-containing protein [Natronobacterium texcoconense]|uniref:HTH DNA binding domain-containing protein n=1 Tax=Natronobacterium texcoconense TaxID=1095778 RepID=A0A1H1CCW4_NATTX|nr:HTH DNA binding domain-containing protein [Natronobacterium texcoconense]
MKRVTFRGRYPESVRHPIHRRITEVDGVSRGKLLAWGPRGSATTLAWYDAESAVVDELLAPIEAVSTVDLIAGDGGTYAFVHQSEYELESAIIELVTGARVVFLPPITFHDSGTVRFEAVGESSSLGEFYADIREYVGCEIERVRPFARRESRGELTERQRDALDAAVAVGYYDVPRTGAVADVAAELDCSRSTAGELIRKAEARVMTAAATSGGISDSV